MDIILERMLSLIPRKDNGDFQHGALKAFAQSIGLKSGNLISNWLTGQSKSYSNYVYEVAAKYDVSVEWLRGETDEKKPAADATSQFEAIYSTLSAENRAKVDDYIALLLFSQQKERQDADDPA